MVVFSVVVRPFLESMAGLSTEKRLSGIPARLARNLASAQESFYADRNRYATSLEALNAGLTPSWRYETSHNVVIEILAASDSGWFATAAHSVSTHVCMMHIGKGVPTQGGEEGTPRCFEKPD